ncbi:uncharacterized protein [Nicotiana tomentosiformis]|uniref:uncharacterized protein n=1 Tax=Nicotiana tomentosiformis TaxID=4098 RepID=UPI00388CCAFA
MVEDLEAVPLFEQLPDRRIHIGARLNPDRRVLKKQNQFEWTEECRQAFKDLKAYLTNPPLLSKPRDGERLFVYLAVTEVAVSAVLVRRDKGTWTLFIDGFSNIKGFGLGIVLIPPSGESIRQVIKCYPITNNEAEYEAVMAGLELARELSIEQIMIKSDSQLQYLEKARELVRQFQSWKIVQILREENVEADALAKLALVTEVTSEKNAIVIHLFHSALDQDKHKFGVPKEIVCDNGPQFIGSKITKFFQSWQIKRITSSPYHPVVNGQANSTNKIIINNLKKRLEKSKGNWPKELPGVLWAYRTTAKTTTGETPFSLVYGSEALKPVEMGEPSTRFTLATEESNDEELRTNLDLLEQRREEALIRMAAQKQIIERYYNQKAHLRYFKIGDFVLKKIFQSTKTTVAGKLNPNWEGPYKVRGIAGKGAYELETMDGKVLPSS